MESTGITTLQERRKLNEEIERAFINAVIGLVSIRTYLQTGRGATSLGLYENFYAAFTELVVLTSDLPQLKQSDKEVKDAMLWIDEKIDPNKEKAINARLESGIALFQRYKKILAERGVITLPPK